MIELSQLENRGGWYRGFGQWLLATTL